MSQTSLLLERLGALIQRSVRDDAARHGLLPIHLQVLLFLMRANRYSDLPIRQPVAEYFGITRGTVSQTIAVLERKGLLTREADARHGKRVGLADRRRQVSLEPELGRTRRAGALRTGCEAATLESTLRNLLSVMQRSNGQRAFGLCRECAHFLTEQSGARLRLTHEPLATEQTVRICREWSAAKAERA